MKININRRDIVFITIVMVVHAVFFLLARRYTRLYMGDSFEYIYEALNIRDHGFFYSGNPALPISPEYMTQRQPGYPLFLLSVYLFTVNNWVVLVLQNLLSVFNICYLRKALGRLGYDQRYDWLLLLLTVAYPAQFINANTIAPDILLQTFALLYFGNFVAFFQTRQSKYGLWMSAALVAGMMVKPVLYPFSVVHIFIVAAVGLYQKVSVKSLALIALFPLMAMFTYSYWNYNRTGKFHFTSNQSFNAIYYYYAYFSAKEGAGRAGDFLTAERTKIASIPEYRDRYDYANKRGLQLLKDNVFPYMAFHLKNTARIFIEPGKAEMDLFTGKLSYGRLYSKEQTGFFATWKASGTAGMGAYIRNNPSLVFVILVFIFNCVRLTGLFCFFRMRTIHWLLRLFVFLWLFYFALAAGPIANTRYFLPVSLVAAGCAAIGIACRRSTTKEERPLKQSERLVRG